MGYLDELLGYQQQSQISGKGKLQGNQVEAAFRGYIGAQETAAQNSRQLDLQNIFRNFFGASLKHDSFFISASNH